ncbi:DegV family protein [Chloroflexota bacterium]
MTIKIVTDSAADLPTHVTQEHKITVVPSYLRFGSEVYRDGVDLTADEFFSRLSDEKVLPATSIPSPGDFAEAYDKLAEETDQILVITISSKLSGIYEVALQSMGLMKKKCSVEVIDSQVAAMAEGLLVISAAKVARTGVNFDDVKDIVRHNIPRVNLIGAFDTLEYLQRGGRIGKAQAFLGSMLKINPVIGLKDGEVIPIAKTRSRGKAIDHLYNLAMSYSRIEDMAIEYAANLDEAEVLAERLSPKFSRERIYFSRVGPAIGTHTGPSLIILSVLGDTE